jgi:hypothetical protein
MARKLRHRVLKLLFPSLRGWFDSLVAVQGDLPVMTAKLRHWFSIAGEPVYKYYTILWYKTIISIAGIHEGLTAWVSRAV